MARPEVNTASRFFNIYLSFNKGSIIFEVRKTLGTLPSFIEQIENNYSELNLVKRGKIILLINQYKELISLYPEHSEIGNYAEKLQKISQVELDQMQGSSASSPSFWQQETPLSNEVCVLSLHETSLGQKSYQS